MYTTNVLNQYTEVADANYTYDEAGNMTNDGQYEYGAACPFGGLRAGSERSEWDDTLHATQGPFRMRIRSIGTGLVSMPRLGS